MNKLIIIGITLLLLFGCTSPLKVFKQAGGIYNHDNNIVGTYTGNGLLLDGNTSITINDLNFTPRYIEIRLPGKAFFNITITDLNTVAFDLINNSYDYNIGYIHSIINGFVVSDKQIGSSGITGDTNGEIYYYVVYGE